jgi:AcrR family transcriptional regulator
VEESVRGYAKGRERRERIIAAATACYADAGYRSTSLREIAKRAGMSHTGLLYYFPNREALLTAVLERRDHDDAARGGLDAGAGVLPFLLDLAGRNADAAGMVEVYARLAAEAITDDHPAHEYFTRHYRGARELVRGAFEDLARQGRLREGADPAQAAVAFVALMDGLQVQWLHDPRDLDLVTPLEFFLRQLLASPQS